MYLTVPSKENVFNHFFLLLSEYFCGVWTVCFIFCLFCFGSSFLETCLLSETAFFKNDVKCYVGSRSKITFPLKKKAHVTPNKTELTVPLY